MEIKADADLAIAAIMMIVGVVFIFKPEVVGIIIGLFLIIMGFNSIIKHQSGKHGWRKKA